jgi:hypothetical protein
MMTIYEIALTILILLALFVWFYSIQRREKFLESLKEISEKLQNIEISLGNKQ